VKLGIDIETKGLDPTDGDLCLIQIYDPHENKCIIWDALLSVVPKLGVNRKLAFNGSGGRRYIDVPYTGIAHNATFEERWLRERLGAEFDLDDTMIASRVLYTGTNAARGQFSHSLAAVAKRELKRELPKDEQESDWSARPLTRSQLEYAARDAMILPSLFDTLMRKIDEAGLRKVYDLELRVARAVDQMERNGFALHEGRLHNFIEGTKREAAQLRKELEDAWGINPGSSKQLREYFGLADRADWPVTAGGAPKTDQDAMRALEDEHPKIAKWFAWKRVEKMRSTYGESLRKKVVNGRIHGRFHQFGTATGRFSSADPNLQNIPKAAAIRGKFWSGSEDRVLIKADYSGIELWLAAVLWREHRMMKLLAEGVNLHTATASSIYGIPREQISKDSTERHVGKTTNFALLYGAGPNRLRQQLASDGVYIDEDEAYKIFRKFLDTYPAFNRRRQIMKQGFESGRLEEVQTPIGRRRNDSVDWYGPYMNHEIQGTGADGLKFAMARIHETNPFRSAKMVCARSTRRDRVRVRCEGG
jgi:DNA polymerase I-like protein with 3'-5' exonuclease and polymerase domains